MKHLPCRNMRKYVMFKDDAKYVNVERSGFVVHPKMPWLGCSPDGIVTDEKIPVGCVEVKCPYSKRNMQL